jgi:hypothetical protein
MSDTRLTCGKCDNGWICEERPDQPWPHGDCAGAGRALRRADMSVRGSTFGRSTRQTVWSSVSATSDDRWNPYRRASPA